MDLKSALQLNLSYQFQNVCTLYPVSLLYAMSFDTETDFLNMFMPYMLSKEILNLNDTQKEQFSLFEIVLSSNALCSNFISTLKVLCKTDNIRFNQRTLEIFINDNQASLNKNNFDAFSDVILEMLQAKRLKRTDSEEPEFKTEEGRKRWLELQKSRKKYSKNNELHLYDMINLVQFGMNSYVPDSEIRQWTYWKLVKSYSTIMNKQSYNNAFDIYLQCGDKKLIEKHWSELIKL